MDAASCRQYVRSFLDAHATLKCVRLRARVVFLDEAFVFVDIHAPHWFWLKHSAVVSMLKQRAKSLGFHVDNAQVFYLNN